MNFRELLQVNQADTLRFFYSGLRETAAAQELSQMETLYTASVFAHYAKVSCAASDCLSAPTGLTQVFDRFMQLDPIALAAVNDPEILETAASQCLFVLSFFAGQMKRRHNLTWFEQYGRAFYLRTSYFSPHQEKRKVLWLMSKHFDLWVKSGQEFQANLRDTPYLLG